MPKESVGRAWLGDALTMEDGVSVPSIARPGILLASCLRLGSPSSCKWVTSYFMLSGYCMGATSISPQPASRLYVRKVSEATENHPINCCGFFWFTLTG